MSFLFLLWMLAADPKWSTWLPPSRAPHVAVWVATAAARHGASMRDARLSAVFMILESGADPFAVNKISGACGPMQELGAGRRGHPCEELENDPVLAVEVWFEDLDDARQWCRKTHAGKKEKHLRSYKAALGVLAGGDCGAEPKIVDERCLWSTDNCEGEE